MEHIKEMTPKIAKTVEDTLTTAGIPVKRTHEHFGELKYHKEDRDYVALFLVMHESEDNDVLDGSKVVIEYMDKTRLGVRIASYTQHDNVKIGRVDTVWEKDLEGFDTSDESILNLVRIIVRDALPLINKSLHDKTLEWMVPENMRSYMDVNLDAVYGYARDHIQLDTETRMIDTRTYRTQGQLNVKSTFELRSYKDVSDDLTGVDGRPITKVTIKSHTFGDETTKNAHCAHIDGDTVVVMDTDKRSMFARERAKQNLPEWSADMLFEKFCSKVRYELQLKHAVEEFAKTTSTEKQL